MRKINWLVGSIALGLGMAVGIVGYAVATTPAVGDSLLMKFKGGNDPQTVTVNSDLSTNLTDSTANTNNSNETFPASASGEGTASVGGAESEEISGGSTDGTTNSANGQAAQNNVQNDLVQKIVSDYKQDIGLFFGAWKSTDMVSFRAKLAKAYAGDLYEKHARQAEDFIVQGVGLDISDIRFDKVNVESATSTSATLEATYGYVAQDYSLGEQSPMGEKIEHQVHVRVNLIQTNAHWIITGETPLS